jgi:hypothetical protein
MILSDDDHALLMMGSSNFTTAGLGIGEHARNIEANLAYLISQRRHEREWHAIDGILPEAEKVPRDKVRGQVALDTEGENASDEPGLPAFFGSAVYDTGAVGRFVLRLGFAGEVGAGPASWKVMSEEGRVLYDDARWASDGGPAAVELPAPAGVLPSGLVVEWAAEGPVRSWWPVVVASGATLPPPDELRDLALQALLEVITSARPVHDVLTVSDGWPGGRRRPMAKGALR